MYTGSDDEINSTRNNRGEHALRYHPVFQKHSAWRNNSQARRAARQHVAVIIEKDALCGVAEGCEDDLSFELNNTSNRVYQHLRLFIPKSTSIVIRNWTPCTQMQGFVGPTINSVGVRAYPAARTSVRGFATLSNSFVDGILTRIRPVT